MANLPDIAEPVLFSGEYRSTLDGKNRVTVPARWRNDGALKEVFLIRNAKRGCLTALPREVFRRLDAEARAKAPSLEVHRQFISQLYSKATDCPVDSQGRMILSEELRHAAGVGREVVLTGSSDRFELWSPAAWTKCQEKDSPVFDDMTAEIGL